MVPSVRFAMQGELLAMQRELKKSYPLERRGGSFKCWGRRCQVCLNLTETETFTSASTNQTYKIDHDFNLMNVPLFTCQRVRSAINIMLDKADIFRSRSNNEKVFSWWALYARAHIEYLNSEVYTGFLENVIFLILVHNEVRAGLYWALFWQYCSRFERIVLVGAQYACYY